MKVNIDGVKEYILVSIGVVGEVEEAWLVTELKKQYSYRFIRKIINELINEKCIKRTKEKRLRLRKPDGLKALREKSSPVFQNYMMITNGHTFPSGEIRERRRTRDVKIKEHFLTNNIPINFYELHLKTAIGRKTNKEDHEVWNVIGLPAGLAVESRSIFDGDRIKSFEEQMQFIEPDDQYFFTSKIIRVEEHGLNNRTTSRTHSSRMHGVYISKMNFYPVYYIGVDSEWPTRIERQTNTILRNGWWKRWDMSQQEKEYQENMKGSAIFFYDNPNLLANVIERITGKRKGVLPWEVYDYAYYIPLGDERLLQLISEKSFQEKTINSIFGENSSPNSFYDAVINGNPAWEVISNDIVKIRKIKKLEQRIMEQGNEIILVAQTWQEDFLKELFEDPKIILLEEKEIDTVIENLKEK